MKSLLATIALVATFSSGAIAMSPQTPAPASDTVKRDISRTQALQRADDLFAMFDVNHDGIMTKEEAQQVGERLLLQRETSGKDSAPGIGGHTLKFLERAFADVESVSRPQFEQAFLRHFDAMDLNHDGVLTEAERDQARGQRADASKIPPQ